MKNTNEKEITRREFLKGSLALMGAAAIGNQLMPASKKGLISGFDSPQASGEKWVKSYCSSCIWPNCGTEVKVVDGLAVELRGNKDHPYNNGTVCPRGNALLMSLYNPYRVKAPMKRTNPKKGRDVDPGWVEISWEEALQTVSDRLLNIQQTDPRKLLCGFGFSSNLHEAPLAAAFPSIFGSPNSIASAGALCEVHYAPSVFNVSGIDRIDLGYCNYLIDFGRNIGGSTMFSSGPGLDLADALERGMKLIVVDPHASPEASKGEWVPIKPGTDVAFGLAMLHLILHEIKQYDAEAVKTRTNLPYLIDAEGEYVRDPETDKPLLWDRTDRIAKAYDDPSLGDVALEGTYTIADVKATPAFGLLKQSVADTTPEWAEELTTVPAAKICEITEKFVEESRLGSTITLEGVEYPYRPAALTCGRGSANQMQGRDFYMLANTINIVMGGMGVPGSVICYAPIADSVHAMAPVSFNVIDGIAVGGVLLWLPNGENFTIPQTSYSSGQFYPDGFNPPHGAVYEAILDPEKYYLDYEIDTFMYYGYNASMAEPNADLIEAALTKIPFTVGIAYNFDEPSYWADILLPESSNYERYHARPMGENMAVGKESIKLGGIHAKAPVIDKPLYDTMQFEDILIELADRTGSLPVINGMYSALAGLPPEKALDPTKKYTYKEMVDIRLQAFTGDANKGLDYFRENGFYDQRLPLTDCYEYYPLKQQNARIAIYNYPVLQRRKSLEANLKKFNVTIPGWDDQAEPMKAFNPLPEWEDNWQTSPPAEFDLYAVNWKTSLRNIGIGGQDDNPFLRELVEEWDYDDLYIQINTATAKAKGFKTGDRVLVESIHGGKVEGVIKTTDLIHPAALGFPAQGGHWSKHMNPRTRQGTNYNQLLSMKEGELMLDGPVVISPPVKVSKI